MAFGKLNLDDFHISRTTGFLIENPLELLPKPFHIWQEMAIRMPELVAAKRIRQCVDEMPLLDHTALTGYRERRLAHLLLMALGTGYVWQDGDRGVPQGLPESLAMPWWGLSRDLGLTPSVNHAALVLANWKFLNAARPFSLDNIDWLCPFPGGDSAKWFVLITTQMERVFVKGLLSIESAIGWVCACDVQGLTGCLREVQQVIRALKSTLSQMQERVNPEVFYSQLRPFLAGWGGEGSPLPKGLIYTGVSSVPQQFTGGSAAQSSIFQTLDAFLGVEHTHSQRDFLLGMRQYMPPDHRRFIETLEAGRLVRDFVLSSSDEELTKAYSECVDSLIDFRSYHIQVVTKYVVIMSQKSERNKDYDSVSKMGTGGSSLVPFLKAIRSTTEDARLPKKQ